MYYRISLFALAATPLSAVAQDFLGHTYNVEVSATSRGALGLAAGETMTRLDAAEHAGWGIGAPGYRTVRSIACVVQDADAATAETFDIKLYPENPANPGFPDLANGVVFVTAAPGPTGSGPLAALRVLTPIAPVAVPIQGSGDVFVSFVLPAATATDGLSMHVVLGYATGAFPRWDTPSTLQGGSPPPAAGPANSYFVNRIGAAMNYSLRRQHWLDVAHTTAGGTGLAITSQPNYPSSANPPPVTWGPAPGTATFLSGSCPDAMATNPGRADDLAMRYTRFGFGNGRVVVFLLDQDFTPGFGSEFAASLVFPGATGVSCLVNPSIFGFALTVSNEAWLVTPIPAAIRPTLAGLVVKQQAAGIDALGVFHAGPCDAMRF